MKFKLILVVAVTLFSIPVFAQKPEFEFKAGMNIAHWKLGDDYDFKNKARVGLLTGFSAEIPATGALGVQAELTYAMFGSTFKNSHETGKYKTSYLLLPVMGEYHFENGISVQFGPQFGYLLSAKSNLDGEKYDFKDDMKKTDVFIVAGAEYILPRGLRAGLRIQHGLSNVETDANTTLKNRAVTLYMAYRLQGTVQDMVNELFKS